jgi:phosphatidylserine/phosphatidylglycerophosphate/cardiolipin synthase-like enzyme
VRVLIDGHEAFGRIYEAVDEARSSVWITVSFVDLDAILPGRSETFLDVVARATGRGVDVRLLFWWSEYAGIGSYRGEASELARLAERGVTAKMRWDAVPRGCHHQKSYVVDGDTAFVGGINITGEAGSSPDHGGGGYHDLFTELRGPVVQDVAANFIERWNQATVTREQRHAFPSLEEADDLLPIDAPADRGSTHVQLVRTLRRELYRGEAGWLPDERFELHGGEDSIRRAVLGGIAEARRSIYLENQFLMDPETIDTLASAAERGVEVIAIVPFQPDPNLLLYPEQKMRETRRALSRLAAAQSAGLFGLIHERDASRAIYVHAKLLIVDDSVLQLGSANFWPPSYNRDSELNVVVWDGEVALDTRRRLWDEHLLGSSATGLADWRRLAQDAGQMRSRGRCAATRIVEIDPQRYYVFAEHVVAPWESLRDGDRSQEGS